MDQTEPRYPLRTRFKPARLKLSPSAGRHRLERTSLHELLVKNLREMIVDGELRSGAPLPEQMLCETFGVSRTPLREAFKVLASEGLIDLRPNRTPIIAPIDRGEIAHIFEVMQSLDEMVARKAVMNASDADIVRLDAMHAELISLHRKGERAPYFRLNQKIHIELTLLARNPVLFNIWISLHTKIFRARALANYDPIRWAESAEEHEDFMRHLRAHDAELFVGSIVEHTRRTGSSVLDNLAKA